MFFDSLINYYFILNNTYFFEVFSESITNLDRMIKVVLILSVHNEELALLQCAQGSSKKKL